MGIDFLPKKLKCSGYAMGVDPVGLQVNPSKELNYGKEYQYSHDGPGNFVNQEFLPEAIQGTTLYQPRDNAREQELRAFLSKRWKGKYGY
jgi:replication-associated recombination protein RarA